MLRSFTRFDLDSQSHPEFPSLDYLALYHNHEQNENFGVSILLNFSDSLFNGNV